MRPTSRNTVDIGNEVCQTVGVHSRDPLHPQRAAPGYGVDLQGLLRASPMPMVVFNRDGFTIDANDAFAELLGHGRVDVIGVPGRDMWFGPYKSTLDDALLWLFTEVTENLSVRCQLMSGEGLPVWAEMHMSVSIGETHSEVLAIVQDCTDEMWDSGFARDFEV